MSSVQTNYAFNVDSGTTVVWGLHLRNVMHLGFMFTILTCLVSACFLITSRLTACFKLTSCNPNTANQNMHAFGVMVIVRFTIN